MNGQLGQASAYGFPLTATRVSFGEALRAYRGALLYGGSLLLLTNMLMAYLPTLINASVLLIDKSQPYVLRVFQWSISFAFFPLLGFIVVLATIVAVLRTLSRRVLFGVGRTIERDVRERLFFHLSTLDDGCFNQHSVGDLMNRLSSDMANIRMMVGFAALNILNIVFVFIFTVPLMVKIDPALAVCSLLPFPLIILTMRGLTKRMFQATLDYQSQMGKLISHVQENLLGAHVVRLFHQQARENERFAQTNQATYDAAVRLARVRVLMQPIMRLMVGLAVGLALYVGGRAVSAGRISVGDFVEINARILQIAWPAMSVGFVMSVLSRGQASMSRINNLFQQMPRIVDGAKDPGPITALRIDDLTLNHEATVQGSAVSVHLVRGQLLGVVGPSGSFKSTLLRALSRRVVVPRQRIALNGCDINDIALDTLYREIAVVSEESFLFHKSLRENICFAKPDATAEELTAVLVLTRLDRDIESLSGGIETMVGDRGITLSGGQRQRVALARALLAKRSVLILDDALSSVDAETEHHIVGGLKTFHRDGIVIIATHRLSAVKDANHIIVLNEGRVVEAGTHRDLMDNGTLYQQLWGLDKLQGLWT
jgi:ATP-binding cassette subfamily B multidrug efflux pump